MMQDDQAASPKNPRLRSSSSFIYPVKSLLSGIQPANDQGDAASHSSDAVTSPSVESPLSSRFRNSHPNMKQWSNDMNGATNLVNDWPGTYKPTSSATDVRNRRSFSVCQIPSTSSPPARSEGEPSTSPPSPTRRRSRKLSPNFRFFPGEDSPDTPRSFSRRSSVVVTSSSPATIESILHGPAEETAILPTVAHSNLEPRTNMALPPSDPLSTAGDITDEILSSAAETLNARTMLGDTAKRVANDTSTLSVQEADAPNLPFNPSEYGLVHLAPISAYSSRESDTLKPAFASPDLSGPSGKPLRPAVTTVDRPPSPSSKSDTNSATHSISVGSDESSAIDDPYHTTFRFQYAQDEHGHHVVIGREGQLRRCEDEPICTPGAVQGFGVLLAFEETEDALVVRQVSENSTELLGLSPSYLFSLRCFTDTLPDSQSCLLLDNIQFLSVPTSSSDEEDNDPQVFLLTGWGEPGSALPGEKDPGRDGRRTWTCWCAIHQTDTLGRQGSGLIVMEFELERDMLNPLYSPAPNTHKSAPAESEGNLPTISDGARGKVDSTTLGEQGDRDPSSPTFREVEWVPNATDISESTTSRAKPLPALERLRGITQKHSDPRGSRLRHNQGTSIGGVGMMDIFALMTQINEQFDAAPDLNTFLKVVVGVIKDLTQFHRVIVYQFDEAWNGQVVAELVDWDQTHDLYQGLNFPASDIPAQARTLYACNKVRLLYDRTQTTARIVVSDREDLHTPLNMTHCYLRAMSPIHLKYLDNMGVRASMSVSILAFGQLWGLVACHAYGDNGMRVSFPVRQMLRLLSQAISRNVERLSYARRLHTRKMINSLISDRQPSGYIVSNADDLLGLFDADFGILVIGEGAKLLGPNQHGQEVLIVAEYLRLKQFTNIHTSEAVTVDFPDLQLSTGLEAIAGLLHVPLSAGGKDFIALLRKGQRHKVRWAGKPYKDSQSERKTALEPRRSFKVWCETVAGHCRAWTDEELDMAGVLSLVYGKFIEVWRRKENAAETKRLTSLLLSNATHEVRTPLNHIINYLELALNGPLDMETRANLTQSHVASKSLLFTINDLLDLTKLEIGNETSFNEPFDLHTVIKEATLLYRKEAERRHIKFHVDFGNIPQKVVGDANKIRTVMQNLTANASKYTTAGSISVCCNTYQELSSRAATEKSVVEIIIADTGCGIPASKLEMIFREFEQVDSAESRTGSETGVGLGLAVVARNVQQLGGQLRVESKLGEGSRFSFLIPLALPSERCDKTPAIATELFSESFTNLRPNAQTKFTASEIDHWRTSIPVTGACSKGDDNQLSSSQAPLMQAAQDTKTTNALPPSPASSSSRTSDPLPDAPPLRVLVVEDNDINRAILSKRLRLNGHVVVGTTNGRECLAQIEADQSFDVILMDIQMPLLNGFETTQRIRALERSQILLNAEKGSLKNRRLSHVLNGRIPIFAVSASLLEKQKKQLLDYGLDGWILKPIDFKRLKILLRGLTDQQQRHNDVYCPGYNWESGGWLGRHD